MIDDCLKVTSYFGERERTDGRFLSERLLDTLHDSGIATSILLRATGGFGLRHHLRTDRSLTMSEDPSVMLVAADTRARITPVLPRLAELQTRGMLTVERVRLVRDGAEVGLLPEQTKLTVHLGRHDRVQRAPAYVAVCDLLHRRGISGAVALVGVDGTRGGERRRARFFSANHDVPTMILAVGEGARVRQALPELGGLLERPVVTVERVRVCKRDGALLARPPTLPDRAGDGLPLWQKLTVHTSESHLHGGEPVHRGILRRLRETGARGATCLRGTWGFHGDHPPHGDRLLQVGRRVPVLTVVVDTPQNIAAAFDVIHAMTTEHGLVTSETVPAMQYFGPDSDGGGLRPARHDY